MCDSSDKRIRKQDILCGQEIPADFKFNSELIPAGLQEIDRFVGWSWGRNSAGQLTKPPKSVSTGYGCDCTDETNHACWADAAKAITTGKVDGLGIALGELPWGYWLCGMDLDDCRDPDSGNIDPWALKLIHRLDSYTEISPSGTGTKTLFLSSVPIQMPDEKNIEVYYEKRYFALTGARLPKVETELVDRTEMAVEMFGKYEPYITPDDFVITQHGEANDFDVVAFLDEHCVTHHGLVPYSDGKGAVAKIILESCPFCENCDRPAIILTASGRLGYHCFHNSCEDMHWADFRHKLQIDALMPELLDESQLEEEVNRIKSQHTKFPGDLIPTTGMLGDIIKFELAGAHYPQPVFALAGALSFMAGLLGRRVKCSYGTWTNAYFLTVGQTGSGKDRARVANQTLGTAADMGERYEANGFTSEAGMIRGLENINSRVFHLDEMGLMLSRVTNSKASSHEKSVLEALLKLYSSSGSMYANDRHADRRNNITIHHPCATVLGMATPRQLADAVSEDMIENGLISRILIFEADKSLNDHSNDVVLEPEESLVDSIKGFVNEFPEVQTLNGQVCIFNHSENSKEFCEEKTKIFRDTAYEMLEEGDVLGSLWIRAAENANKLALIKAVSDGQRFITLAAAQWAYKLVERQVTWMAQFARERISGSPFEHSAKKIYRYLKGRGGWVNVVDVGVRFGMKAKERDEILHWLGEAGYIEGKTEKAKSEKGGRPKRFVRTTSKSIGRPGKKLAQNKISF